MTPKLLKEVKAIVHKPSKYVATDSRDYLITDTINTNVFTNLYTMIPDLIQGVDENQRIADRVVPHVIRSNFTLYLDQSNNFSADVYVRVMCLNVKAVKSASSTGGFLGRDLLNKGNGTSIDPPAGSGSTITTLQEYSKYPINTKAYSVFYDKVHRISKNQGQLTGDGTSTTSPVVPQSSTHNFVVHPIGPAQMKYDGAITTSPNNFYPVWCAYAWSSTGAPFSGGFVHCTVRNDMLYTDA